MSNYKKYVLLGMAKVQTKNFKNKQFMKPIIHNTKTSFITERKICSLSQNSQRVCHWSFLILRNQLQD